MQLYIQNKRTTAYHENIILPIKYGGVNFIGPVLLHKGLMNLQGYQKLFGIIPECLDISRNAVEVCNITKSTTEWWQKN